MNRSVTWLLGFALLSGTATACSAASSAPVQESCGTGWETVGSFADGDILDVAAISDTDVWAVGSSATTPDSGVAEHWDGTAWTSAPTPATAKQPAALRAVAAVSPTDVWAVGAMGSDALAERWDGAAWTVVPFPTPTGATSSDLVDVAATAASDVWVVGRDGISRFFVGHWDGISWQIVLGPVEGDARAIAARSPQDVWVVGGRSQLSPMAEHFDGTSWTAADPTGELRHDPTLESVAAAGPTDVWAMGSNQPAPEQKMGASHMVARRWSGATWTAADVARPPFPAFRDGLHAVAAASATDVWTAGVVSDRDVSEHWNGSAWQLVPAPHAIADLAATSTGSVWGSGSDDAGSFVQRLCAVPAASADLWVDAPRFCCGGDEWRVGKRETIPFGVWNGGSQPALESGVTILVPTGMRFVGVDSRRASCSILDRHPVLVQCDLRRIQPGEKLRIPVVADVLFHRAMRVELRSASISDPYPSDDVGVAINDVLGSSCTIIGSNRNDRLVGTPRKDVLCGLGGNDRLSGRGGPDVLLGGPGDDLLLGGPGWDTLNGGNHNDVCEQGPGRGPAYSCRE
ncbi:MAG: hypothetical protein ABR600_14075 [Actinomycetota bacterium]